MKGRGPRFAAPATLARTVREILDERPRQGPTAPAPDADERGSDEPG